MTSIKPCPFCGSKRFIFGFLSTTSFVCACRDCGAYGPSQMGISQDTPFETIKKRSEDDWNKRVGDAKELGQRGGLKGGPARAAKMTPEQRSESAKKAAQARWSHPYITSGLKKPLK